MICEKCGEEHNGSYGSGRFCSEKCARSFSTIKDDKKDTKKVKCIICNNEKIINKRASSKNFICKECRLKNTYNKKCKICGKKNSF